jgi:protein-arginine kinase activator protein McsA
MCGRLFQSFGTNMCPVCAEKMDRYFLKVKDYLYEHPDANVFDTSQETGVPEKVVLNFLREGWLSISGMGNMLECEKCGAPIASGRFCLECQNKLEKVLISAYKPESNAKVETQKTSPGRMHVNYHE